MPRDPKAMVVGGSYSQIVLRQAPQVQLQLGELLVVSVGEQKLLIQVTDLVHSSQIAAQHRELVAGMKLDGKIKHTLFDKELRSYTLAHAKPLLTITADQAKPSKLLADAWSLAYGVEKEDVSFLKKESASLSFGNLRSGSTTLNIPVTLSAKDVITHHMLVSATTGKGKSNFLKSLLYKQLEHAETAALVFDPHDEYFGRQSSGLKDHPLFEKRALFFTTNAIPGSATLHLPLSLLKPYHFSGIAGLTDAQSQASMLLYNKFGKKWIEKLLDCDDMESLSISGIHPETLFVLKRKLSLIVGKTDGSGVFTKNDAADCSTQILHAIKDGKTVIVDSSMLSGQAELLLTSFITHTIYSYYRANNWTVHNLPAVSIVLEEAPRVLGKHVLEKGSNIFSTIAREGRKFGVGLCAITQMPSLIPRQVLSNMNTKIILGTELAAERQALVESASQDLSADHRTIASMDKGEAIITSNFSKFAIPVTFPHFEKDVVGQITVEDQHIKKTVSGLK